MSKGDMKAKWPGLSARAIDEDRSRLENLKHPPVTQCAQVSAGYADIGQQMVFIGFEATKGRLLLLAMSKIGDKFEHLNLLKTARLRR